MDLKTLRSAFPVSLIQWKPQSTNEERGMALAVPYIDARAVMGRLDEVVGPENWADSYHVVEYEGKLRMCCSLSIYCGEQGWVSKRGFGEPPEGQQIDEGKGAESDALKRAAVKWGIGRYIYSFPKRWLKAEFREVRGKKRFVKFLEQPEVPDWAHPKAGPVSTEHDALPESEAGEGDEPEWKPKDVGEVKKAWAAAAQEVGMAADAKHLTDVEVGALKECVGAAFGDLEGASPEELADIASTGLAAIKAWKKGG